MSGPGTAPTADASAAPTNGAVSTPPPEGGGSVSTSGDGQQPITRADLDELRATLSKENAKLRYRLKQLSGGGGGSGAGATSTSGDPAGAGVDIDLVRELGRAEALLSPEQRQDLEELQEQGASIAEIARLAKILAKHSKPSGARDAAPPPPPSKAATAAPLHAPSAGPRSQHEYFAMTKEARDELHRLRPEFDASDLPRR